MLRCSLIVVWCRLKSLMSARSTSRVFRTMLCCSKTSGASLNNMGVHITLNMFGDIISFKLSDYSMCNIIYHFCIIVVLIKGIISFKLSEYSMGNIIYHCCIIVVLIKGIISFKLPEYSMGNIIYHCCIIVVLIKGIVAILTNQILPAQVWPMGCICRH